MINYTSNLRLAKPSIEENISPEPFNDNFDKIDKAYKEMKENFQAGVDSVYDACVTAGSTPSSKSLADVVTAIGKVSQVYYLGEGTSFNVSSIEGYEKLTADNFIVDCGLYGVSGSATYCGGASNSTRLTKSYNPSTGLFTINNTSVGASNGETHNAVWEYGEGFSDKGFTINIAASRSPQVWVVVGGQIKTL